jgi:hypothetical protein
MSSIATALAEGLISQAAHDLTRVCHGSSTVTPTMIVEHAAFEANDADATEWEMFAAAVDCRPPSDNEILTTIAILEGMVDPQPLDFGLPEF